MDPSQSSRGPVGYSLRLCRKRAELAACQEVQKKIWGYAEHELYPLRLFVNLVRVGGHVLGAFTAEEELVGFVAAMPAWHGKQRYFHSLALGVIRGHENRGLGRALKLAQRDLALGEGVDCIEWTFDPLRAKNANLNINRLGAVVRRYEPDCYGQVDSQLQQGLPSDRLIAEWELSSLRVTRALAGQPPRDPGKKAASEIEIPASIDAWVKQDPENARKVQSRVREDFQRCFAHDLTVTGLVLNTNSAYYLLDSHEN